jgi:hypothetical protein
VAINRQSAIAMAIESPFLETTANGHNRQFEQSPLAMSFGHRKCHFLLLLKTHSTCSSFDIIITSEKRLIITSEKNYISRLVICMFF